MLNQKLEKINTIMAAAEEETRLFVLDFDQKKAEIKNLLDGYKKYEKENRQVAEQMRALAQNKVAELKTFEAKYQKVKSKQDALKRELMNIFQDSVQVNKKDVKVKVAAPVREFAIRPVEPEKVEDKKIEITEKKKPVMEEKPVNREKIQEVKKVTFRSQAEEASRVQQKLAQLALGRSYGNA